MSHSPHSLPPSTSGRADTATSLRAVPVVPGYDLVRILGKGGMGVVWEAREHRFDRRVALKLQGGDGSPEAVGQLWREAQLAARIAHAGIVAVYDFGYALDGRPYYTMDFVEGTELRALLRDGPLPRARALALAAEVAEAVAAAHEHGVVHGDVTPRNVIVDATGHARILDFGLGHTIAEGERPSSPNLLRGSPPYMAPEQVAGKQGGRAADIWAIGVMLYEMLAGRRPFEADTTDQLLYAIATQPPAPLSRAGIAAPDIELAILSCLDKDPSARPSSARALAQTISCLAEGRPPPAHASAAIVPYSPRLPTVAGTAAGSHAASAASPVRVTIELQLSSPPEALWPFVADTDRFNSAAGLPVVRFTDAPDPLGGSSRVGHLRRFGLELEWTEHPFEWIKDREHSVQRTYRKGPVVELVNRVRLEPSGDGTRLVHDISIAPRNVLGRLLAWIELRTRSAPRMRAVYARVDAAARAGAADRDPFDAAHRPSLAERQRVERGAEMLTRRGFPALLVAKLVGRLLYGPSKALESLRPYVLAEHWQHDRVETLDMLLHATDAGLVDAWWDLICPICRVAHEHARSLRDVRGLGACSACNLGSFERDLARHVELVFRPHPEVRAVARSTHCIGSPAMRPHVVAQIRLTPGAERRIAVTLASGRHRIGGPRLPATWELDVSAAAATDACTIVLHGEGAAQPIDAGPAVVRTGQVTLHLANATAVEQLVLVETAEPRPDAVTAAAAVCHPAFRDFFAAEILAHGEQLAVGRMAFLAIEVEDRAGLVQELGDARALAAVSDARALVTGKVRAHLGAVVESSFQLALLASFPTSAHAVGAALAVQSALAESGPVRLRAAVHEGRCLAIARDDRIEYFGETIQRTAAMLAECAPGGVVLSGAAADDRAAAAAVHAARVHVEVTASSSRSYRGRRIVRLLPETA